MINYENSMAFGGHGDITNTSHWVSDLRNFEKWSPTLTSCFTFEVTKLPSKLV